MHEQARRLHGWARRGSSLKERGLSRSGVTFSRRSSAVVGRADLGVGVKGSRAARPCSGRQGLGAGTGRRMEQPAARREERPGLASSSAGLADDAVRWPSQHNLGQPVLSAFDDAVTVLLGCVCGASGC